MTQTSTTVKPKHRVKKSLAGIPKVKHSDLIDLTVESSKYHRYEVEEVLEHFMYHLRRNVLDGNVTNIKDLGWLYKAKWDYNGMTSPVGNEGAKQKVMKPYSRLILRVSEQMMRSLRKIDYNEDYTGGDVETESEDE